jgi:hypothetical protein
MQSVRELHPGDATCCRPQRDPNATAEFGQASDGSYQLSWAGTVCDGNTIVTIDADITSIRIDGGHRPACDSMGIGYTLVFRIQGPVAHDSVEATYDVVVDREPDEASPAPSAALVDGKLAVVGRDGVDGAVDCLDFVVPIAALVAPATVGERIGPEWDVLRAEISVPYADGFGGALSDPFSWYIAARTPDRVLFLADPAATSPELPRAVEISRDLAGVWKLRHGGCQFWPILPAGVTSATWQLDPAFPAPTSTTTTLHLLVDEHVCAGYRSPDMPPAFVLEDRSRIEIAIGIYEPDYPDDGSVLDCLLGPPVPVSIELSAPLGDRELRDLYGPDPNASSGG